MSLISAESMWSTNIRAEEPHAAHSTELLSTTSTGLLISESNMALGRSSRVSWICLLLFSSAACFPATKGGYKYPYTATGGSGGGPAPGSNLQSEGSRAAVSMQYEPSVNYRQPEAAPQLASSPAGSQSPSSLGAPSVAAGSSPSYEPNRFMMTYDSSAPEVPYQSAGYVSPPVGPLPPSGSGKKTPSFSVQSQPVAGSGNSVGSGVASSGPVYEASPFRPPSGFAYPAESAGNMATTMDFGDGPVPYAAAPATYDFAGPAPYGNPSSAGFLPWTEQPVGGAGSSFYNPSNWRPSGPFPDFGAWDSGDQMPQSVSETSPLPPSSYIVQSRNGYQRARKVYSNSKYYQDYPEPPVFPFKAVKAPSKSPPMTGSKGGKGV